MSDTEILDQIEFHGHRNILGTHYNTLELTTDREISKRADCIIGVSASKACAGLTPRLKDLIRKENKIRFSLRVGESIFSFEGIGKRDLSLFDEREIVLRRSEFVSSRTGSVRCTAAARDLPREMIRTLQDPETTGILEIRCVELSVHDT